MPNSLSRGNGKKVKQSNSKPNFHSAFLLCDDGICGCSYMGCCESTIRKMCCDKGFFLLFELTFILCQMFWRKVGG